MPVKGSDNSVIIWVDDQETDSSDHQNLLDIADSIAVLLGEKLKALAKVLGLNCD